MNFMRLEESRMWSDEQLNDAVQVLWSASQYGAVQKVVAKEKEDTETYIVVNDVTYTDPLYVQALDKLLLQKKLQKVSGPHDRQMFNRVESQADDVSLKAI
jgi:hypothetical protein